MKLIKLYFETVWKSILFGTVLDIVVNLIIFRNWISFTSMLLSLIIIFLLLFTVSVLYFWIRYELPHKVKISILRLKLFWKFMKYTEGELKTFELVMNKVKDIMESREKS